ncbi:MAG: ATP phosphoribosyltransferase regulatory subunit [Methylococcales bacterium]|nr:ATP phosphoribosyltransferase regulatory subunit [Methylococcales bacterium]
MTSSSRWLLPEGIEELLPEEAASMEALRRTLLDVLQRWGYALVSPPLVDYLDSLLTGLGAELDSQTFKMTDRLSGKLLGLRADMTPLVARIDARATDKTSCNRLCYAGTVLHAVGDPLEKTRSPYQIGAELYGYPRLAGDLEVIRLMLEVLAQSQVLNVHLDLGHVGIYRLLSEQAALSKEQEATLFAALQAKARAEVTAMLAEWALPDALRKALNLLTELHGGEDVLSRAQAQLQTVAGAGINAALADLRSLAEQLAISHPGLPISFDLAELRGYRYHTGLVFAAFVPEIGRELARGGRYDNVGAVFGRARPATGFSADLKMLARLGQGQVVPEAGQRIFAPVADDADLAVKVAELRAQGLTVIQALPDCPMRPEDWQCTGLLVKQAQGWQVQSVD